LTSASNRPLAYYLDICTRCGACTHACHFYEASGERIHAPAYRAELLRRLLRKRKSLIGRLFPWFVEAKDPDDSFLDELERAMWGCTGCRRCAVYCPFDIDAAWFISLVRKALLEIKRGPEILVELADADIQKGEMVDFLREMYAERIKEIEERLRKEFSPNLRITVEQEGAKIFYVPLAGEHKIVPAAKLFHAPNESWTLSLFTASNYAFFLGDAERAKKMAGNIVKEAKRLGVKVVAFPECGHATRTLFKFWDEWFGELPFEGVSILQLIDQYIREGKIKLKKGVLKDPVTYHDPCNLGRNSGLYEEPRKVLYIISTDFREMNPNRKRNWCCGGRRSSCCS